MNNSSKPNNTILCSTFHDPEFKLRHHLNSAMTKIQQSFSKKIVCCTPITSNKAISSLKELDFHVVLGRELIQVNNYNLALSAAINETNNPNNQRIFYVDFDRLIHWSNNYPDELLATIDQCKEVELLHIGRSERAFNTHPSTQKATENIVNEFGSKVLELKKPVDLISVCYSFTKNLGKKLLELAHTTYTGFYGAWPVILWRNAKTKKYIEVEGQEWETPDRFAEVIEKIGYESWLEEFQTPKEWEKRVKLLRECILEISQITNFEEKN
ncbi:MAG: hypothetical protein GF383_04885 [Candidatus Lokiarchaeota archaeon]|nr:hypothetical protein [Candidatus Lokiarchaeota archaeon]MBD3339157.1 hypothetical protein [Candidatus Lokiarchaeota archaeon]